MKVDGQNKTEKPAVMRNGHSIIGYGIGNHSITAAAPVVLVGWSKYTTMRADLDITILPTRRFFPYFSVVVVAYLPKESHHYRLNVLFTHFEWTP